MALSLALLASGCPQLLEDDFQNGDALSSAGGTPSFGGASSTPPLGGAGGAGNAGDAGSAQALGGGDAGGTGGSTNADAGDATAEAICAGGQSGPSGTCYTVIATSLAWQAARASCEAKGPGWDLATLRSSADTDFIIPLLDEELWIAASDAEEEGIWLWVTSADQFWPDGAAYTNWNDGEPNDVDGADCLRLLTTGKWADLPCEQALGALCAGPP